MKAMLENMKTKKDYLACFLTVLIVSLVFIHTLNYPWKHFDEQIIYKETLLPIPLSFLQIFEYISHFGLNNYIEASNPFYTTIANLRCAPFGALFFLFIFWAFQKSAFAYHALSLVIHLLNTALCFLIFNKISLSTPKASFSNNELRLFLISALTLFWALHPVNVEPVLFASNLGALVTYFFCFAIFYFFISSRNSSSKKTILHSVILFFVYFIPLLLNEYSVTLPFIIFTYLYITSKFYDGKNSFSFALKKTFPLFLTLIFFSIYFIMLPKMEIVQASSLSLFTERALWFSPQVFFHYLKLIFFPIHLTIDQSSLVDISDSLFSPYAIFCSLLVISTSILSLVSLKMINKKVCFYFLIIFVPFFLSLFPFLHIISPLYNLVSERYLYLPLFFLILGILHTVIFIIRSFSQKQLLLFTIVILISLCPIIYRTYIRTLDWKDSKALFSSALKESKDNLIKGLRLQMLGGLISIEGNKTLGGKFINQGTSVLKNHFLLLEEKRKKLQETIPNIVKFYGLDPKTKQAKTAYLLAFTQASLLNDLNAAHQLLRPHMKDLLIVDTQILDFYLGVLFATKHFDEAEQILKHTYKKRLSPTILIIYSELYKIKYNDFLKAEELLLESFRYFPYDARTLEGLANLYVQTKNANKYAYYSYLLGLRAHSLFSLQEALQVYKGLNNKKMVSKVSNAIDIVQKKKRLAHK